MLEFMRYLTNYGSLMDNRPLMVVTGATNGLGRLAAITLAIGGADLAVIARSTDKASRLRQEIVEPLECPEPGNDEATQQALWTATATLVAHTLSATV